jgi:cold-inducible RNA-binding protein
MAKKLYVGNLSWGTTSDQLQQAFAEYGEVSEARVITDRDSGRSRGFGFVTIEDDEAAEQAIAALDGSTLDGRTIKVNEARERAPRREGGGGRRGRGYGGGRGHDRDSDGW